MMFSTNMLSRIGERTHPWRSPTEVRKKSPLMFFWRTALFESSYNALMTSMVSKLKFFMTCHRPSYHTASVFS